MKIVLIVMAAMLFSTLALAQEVETTEVTVRCNWGLLTMEAIADGFPQGPHSSDPAGDGRGRGEDQPRAGLGNAVERGNLQATCEFIESQL